MTPEERLNQAESTAKKASEEAQQAETLESIREMQKQRHRWKNKDQTLPIKQIDALLEMVDSQAQKIAELKETIEVNAAYCLELQGRVKQYTEAELREAYEMHFETAYDSPSVWQGFKDCARFLGAIKEQEG